MEDRACSDTPATERLPDADARLLEQIHSGDAEASRRFVREHYPAIYRYLLYLTRRPEQAEDLTQETFMQAWRHLGTFIARASLRAWLHRIARREFLQALRRQRAQTSLEEIAEAAEPDAPAWMEAVELREVIDRLPLEQREVVLLHYLEGYSSTEIARIVDAPVGTVCYRLAQAREHLRQELGEDDLTYLNEPLAPMRQWAWLPLDQIYALETRLAIRSDTKEDLSMERREFLRQAAAGAAGLVLAESGKEVVDGRLTQKTTLAFKGTALSDLCDHLRAETGVSLTAGASVADEKVTLFCKQMPLRDVMRQLSRPFGHTWLRSTRNGQYRYELVQDLRSQLLEEELRNRDRHAALLALEREIERYRPYLDLTPDEALAKVKTASLAEKPLLEQLARYGWGPLQLYFRLSPVDLAAVRGGARITFSQEPKAGQRLLPADVVRGVLQGLRNWRIVPVEGGYGIAAIDRAPELAPNGLPPAAVSEVRVRVDLALKQGELGQFALVGSPSLFTPSSVTPGFDAGGDAGEEIQGPLAAGINPAVLQPSNHTANAGLARDPKLRSLVTVHPLSTCGGRDERSGAETPTAHRPAGDESPLLAARPSRASEAARLMNVTSADVLQALHLATGMPVVADFYTRLYELEGVSVTSESLFDALNQLADAMRLRWNKDGGCLQFRSVSFYDDRIKEVPNRLLTRWAGVRQRGGWLTLDEICEIAILSDAQLDAASMAEGARDCWGFAEWDLARHPWLRRHLRFMAGLSADQRREAQSATGLAFTKLTLAQQQQFIGLALWPDDEPIESPTELEGAALRVDYTQLGWFQWVVAGGNWPDWVTILEPGPQGRRAIRAPVRERTRAAALQAALQTNPHASEAQLQPTERHLRVLYMPGVANRRTIHLVGDDNDAYWRTW